MTSTSYCLHVICTCSKRVLSCFVCISDLRLVSGVNDDNSSGELQFSSSSGWIPVCYTPQFSEDAADIACKQLGYSYATGSTTTVGSGLAISIINSSSCQVSSQYLFECAEYQEMTCQTRYHLMCRSKYFIPFLFNE